MSPHTWTPSKRLSDLPEDEQYRWQPILVADDGWLVTSIDYYFATAEECAEWMKDNMVGATFDLD